MKEKDKKQEPPFRMEDDILFIHPGIRLNHSDVLTLLREEKLPKYSISISLGGYYLFNTEDGRIDSTADFKRVIEILLTKFPESENYNISVSITKGKDGSYLNNTKDIKIYLDSLN